MATKYIDRYTSAERTNHWIMAAAFLTLIFTGLGLWDKTFLFMFAFFGGGANAIMIHKVAGIIFAGSAMAFLMNHLGDLKNFDQDDAAWLKMNGGYTKKGVKTPPMGKYNAGQKIFGLFVFISIFVFGITGAVMWSPGSVESGLMRFAYVLHSAFFILMAPFFVIHFYMGTLANPGTLEAMTSGKVSEAWAKKHALKWLNELKKEGKA